MRGHWACRNLVQRAKHLGIAVQCGVKNRIVIGIRQNNWLHNDGMYQCADRLDVSHIRSDLIGAQLVTNLQPGVSEDSRDLIKDIPGKNQLMFSPRVDQLQNLLCRTRSPVIRPYGDVGIDRESHSW
ncbi:hypothetical protein SBA4_510005 [Candidatus Sulfopaludibacter sp. SbA4]|nr:hypothetical protein SBA4_510005 [Candidatus Sulfopaludibacter sp. SbA4]